MIELKPAAGSEKGELALAQFREVISNLPEIRGQMNELPRLLKNEPNKLKEVLGSGYYWAGIYELSFIEQIASLMALMGWQEFLKEAASSENPQLRAMELFADGDEIDQWHEHQKGAFEKRRLIWLMVVLQRNILSIMLHHRPLSAFVEQVRRGGDDADEAFFQAVRVDRSILSCPTFSDRLAYAELTQDQAFFRRLRSALKGPLKKHMEALNDLRYAIALLREMGFDQLSDGQLEDLFVNKLKLYPKHAAARKNLRKHFYEAKRVSTTPK